MTTRIRQQWDAAQYLVSRRLPERVSQTWLAPEPGTYPVGVTVQLTGAVKVTTESVSAHEASRTPVHLRVRVDRLVWQVCDRQSWRAIGEAWFRRAALPAALSLSSPPVKLWTAPGAVHNFTLWPFSPSPSPVKLRP